MNSRTALLIVPLLTSLMLTGCFEDEDVFDPPPPAPQGVYSVTADGAVYVYWNGPYDRDVKEYVIWRSLEPVHNYQPIDTREAEDNPRLDLIVYEYIDFSVVNGNTYYYAVSAEDYEGQSSELSAEEVFDTPRPEGEVTFYDVAVRPDSAGFSLAAGAVVPRNSSLADVFIDRDGNGVFYLNVGDVVNDDTEIQGMGCTSSFDDIGWAPQDGWSRTGWAEIIPLHTYVIRTDDLHYAKMRVLGYDPGKGSVRFQWAYQTDQNNPELVAPPDGGEVSYDASGSLSDRNGSNTSK